MTYSSDVKQLLRYNNTLVPVFLELAKPLFENIGITSFSYMCFFRDKITRFDTNKEWYKFFLENKLYDLHSYDDELKLLENKEELIVFRNDFSNPITDLASKFNCWNQLSLYKKNITDVELWTFRTVKNNDEIINFYFNNINLIKRFIIYFKNRLSEVFYFNYSDFFIPRKAKMAAEDSLASRAKNRDLIEKTSIQKFVFFDQHDLKATQREAECLYLSHLGKTAKEISRELRISHRTVETHINKFKLKINNDDLYATLKNCQKYLSDYYAV